MAGDQSTQNIEGLPEGAIVGPPLQPEEKTAPSVQTSGDMSKVEGLPEGAIVGPPLSPSEKKMGGSGGAAYTPKEPTTAGGALWNMVKHPVNALHTAADYYGKSEPAIPKEEGQSTAKYFGETLIPDKGTLGRVGRAGGRLATMLPQMGEQAYHAVTDAPKDIEEGNTEAAMGGGLTGRAVLAGKRMLVDPAEAQRKQIEDKEAADAAAGNPHSWAEKVADRATLVPMVGGIAKGLGERAGTGDIAGTATEAAGYAALPKIAEEAKPGGVLPGAAPEGASAFPATRATIDSAVRTGAKAYEGTRKALPAIGAGAGALTGLATGSPAGLPLGILAGERAGRIAERYLPSAKDVTTHGLPPEEKAVSVHTDLAKKADKAVAKAQEAHAVYAASEAKGPIDPETNPAYKKSLDTVTKAQTAQAEAHYHLQEAKEALESAKVARSAAPDQEITPAVVEASRPAAEEAPVAEKPPVAPSNVRTPGQVQPEVIGEYELAYGEHRRAAALKAGLTEADFIGSDGNAAKPVVPGTVRVGRAPKEPLRLAEGMPEEAPVAPTVMTTPKPKVPGKLSTLKVDETGKVIDTEDPLQARLEEGLRREPAAKGEDPMYAQMRDKVDKIKAAAMRRYGAPVESRGKIEVPAEAPKAGGDTDAQMQAKVDEIRAATARQSGVSAETPKTEPGLMGAEKEFKNEGRSPEDLSKVDKAITELPNLLLIDLGNRFGIDASKYDFSKREPVHAGGSKHPVERMKHAEATRNALPEAMTNHIVDASNDFDAKDTSVFDQASRSNASRAERARAIINEAMKRYTDELAAKGASGGAPDEGGTTNPASAESPKGEAAVKEGGGEYLGIQEGIPEEGIKDTVLFNHPETKSTLSLPKDQVTPEAVRAKLEAHKAAWDKGKTPASAEGAPAIPEKPEDFEAAVKQPFTILGQEGKTEIPEPKVNPAPAEPRPVIDRTKVQGGDVQQPHTNYHEASHAEGNPWVRRSADPANDSMATNEKRTLMVQFASDLLQKDNLNADAKAYYDKLYSGSREGYARMRDFWETPQWMGFASHFLPDADAYVVRDMGQAKEFLNKAGYGNVLFSSLDVNSPYIKELAKEYPGRFDVGGYAKPADLLEGTSNIDWHNSMEDFAKAKGIEYKNGVDYRHFEGSDVIPRLTLSDGCLHKCAFCTVPKEIKMTPDEVVNQQADAIAAMKSKLVYLNDKTFGQAPNYKTLPDIYDRILKTNSDFKGFVVQTTAAQVGKLPLEFLKKSGIKFAEIGVETYNDALLKELHKPSTESLVDKTMAKLKDAGIVAIPNIIIGLPGENAATYAHTLEFLKKNADNISHANVYNLAIYKDAELGKSLTTASPSDFDENVLHKSFHTDPQIHATFAGDMYKMGQELLEKPEGGLTANIDKTITDLHNNSEDPKGSSFHPTDGNLVGKVGYSVGSAKSLEHRLESSTLKPEDIKAYRSRPDVIAALKDNPKAFVGTWEYKGDIYMDVSHFEPDLEKAKALGKENGQKAIYDLKGKKEISLEDEGKAEGVPKTPAQMTNEEFKEKAEKEGGVSGGSASISYSPARKEVNQSKMSPEQRTETQERLAKEGQGGGSAAFGTKTAKTAKMPTGDELIEKYGESDGDPAHTAFILLDGRGVALPPGIDHDTILGGKATDRYPAREQFVANGNIRIRPRTGGKAGREFSVSVPESGITTDQLEYLNKMAPQMGTGKVMVEIGKRGGDFKEIPYGQASDKLESTIRDLVPIKEAKAGPDLGPVAEKYGTTEEKTGIAKSPKSVEKFVENMEKLPEIHEYRDIALAGEGARKWYQRSTKAFDAMMEEAPEYFKEGDRDKFINLLAASSPRQSVAMNLRETLRTWKAYVDAGRPEGEALEKLLGENLTPAKSKVPNALKAINGEEMWPDITKNKAFKVPSFARNLLGWLGSVTNDGWMSLFAGLDPREIASAHSYHPLSIAVRAAAEELGWEPAEAQAAIWAFTQALTERGEELPEEVRKHSEDFVDLLAHDPYTRELLADLGVSHANLDAKLAAIGEKPEVSGRETPTTTRSIERLKERIEKARGQGTIPPAKSAQGELGFREPPAQGSRTRVSNEDTEFNPEKLEAGENSVAGHTYEYNDTGTLKSVTARDADGNSVATVVATPEDDDPNTWTVGFSKATEEGKNIGLGAYTKLAEEAQSAADKTGKSIVLQGDKQMSPVAVHTWIKLGEEKGLDVQWAKDNRPHITFRSSKMGAVKKPTALGRIGS